MLSEQRDQLEQVCSLVESIGACVSSFPSPEILQVAKSHTNERYGHQLMRAVKRSLRVLSKSGEDCDIESQPEIDVSGMRAQAKTADGTVFMVQIKGRPFVLKWAGSRGPSRPFADDAEAVVENVVSCAASAARIAGRVPFFTATYCTFGCRLDKSSIVRASKESDGEGSGPAFYPLSRSLFSPRASRSSWIGLASIQEYVPYGLKQALSMCGLDVVQHAGLMTMIIAAIYFANEILMVNHNDLHLANIRFTPAPGGKVALRWNGRWRLISCPLIPMIIDWGRACEYAEDGVCSDETKYFYKKEGRPITKNADLSSIVSRMISPIENEWMPDKERNPDNLSIFTNALQILAGSRIPRGGTNVQILASAICLLNLFMCCSTEFDESGSHKTPSSYFSTDSKHVQFDTDSYMSYVLSGTQSVDRRPFMLAQSRLFMDTFVKLWPEMRSASPDVVQAVIS